MSQKIPCKGRLSHTGNRLIKEVPHTHEPMHQIDEDYKLEYKSLEDDDFAEWLRKTT